MNRVSIDSARYEDKLPVASTGRWLGGTVYPGPDPLQGPGVKLFYDKKKMQFGDYLSVIVQR